MKNLIKDIKTSREPWLVFLIDKFNNLIPIEENDFILYHKDGFGVIYEYAKTNDTIFVSFDNIGEVLIEEFNVEDSDERILLYKQLFDNYLNITYSDIVEEFFNAPSYDMFEPIFK